MVWLHAIKSKAKLFVMVHFFRVLWWTSKAYSNISDLWYGDYPSQRCLKVNHFFFFLALRFFLASAGLGWPRDGLIVATLSGDQRNRNTTVAELRQSKHLHTKRSQNLPEGGQPSSPQDLQDPRETATCTEAGTGVNVSTAGNWTFMHWAQPYCISAKTGWYSSLIYVW